MTAFLVIAIDVAVVAGVALLAVAVMRRQSAALRHAVLAVALVAAALMPLLEFALPTLPVLEWPLASPIASSSISMSSDTVAMDAGIAPPLANESASFSWPALLLAAWVVGVVCVLGRLLRGFVHLARIESRSHVVDAGRWRELADELSGALQLRNRVTILRSPDPALLVTYGFRRPKLVVPFDADSWSDERIEMALTHELTHVRRRDASTTLLAAVVCALHWFNPLVWLCARNLRRESECACDDAVLRHGMEATRYAALLLSVARGAAAGRPWVTAPAIAHPSTLERRIAAMLQRPRNRAPITRLAKTLVAIATAAIVMPLAAAGIVPATGTEPTVVVRTDVSLPVQGVDADATPGAVPTQVAASPSAGSPRPQTGVTPPERAGQKSDREGGREQSLSLFRRVKALANAGAAPDVSPTAGPAPAAAAAQETGTITATAVDASGGVVPGVTARLFDPSRGLEVKSTMSDANGRFEFRDVLVGQYELTLAIPGFATVHTTMSVTRDGTVSRRLMLPIGTVEETITVVCSSRAAAGAGAGFVARFGRLWLRGVDAFMPVLAAQEPPRAAPVRVGGNIQAPRKVKDVRPVCPTSFLPSTGATVKLAGRIGVDGLMNDVTPVPSAPDVEPPSEVTQSALDAVRQWTFTPTRLNGQMVEANINIRISYR